MTGIRFLALVAVLALTACETMEGLGRDVEATGEAITEEAQEG